MDDNFVTRTSCQTLHMHLEKACDERHSRLGEQVTALTRAIESLGDKLSAVVEGRAADRAWSILGKICVAVGGAYILLSQLASIIH